MKKDSNLESILNCCEICKKEYKIDISKLIEKRINPVDDENSNDSKTQRVYLAMMMMIFIFIIFLFLNIM